MKSLVLSLLINVAVVYSFFSSIWYSITCISYQVTQRKKV